MIHLVLQGCATARHGYCAICERPTTTPSGIRLCAADDGEPVCLDCGRQHAPALAALVQLAGETERIARIGRHTVFPPLTALLDLARAAENYHQAAVAVSNPPLQALKLPARSLPPCR